MDRSTRSYLESAETRQQMCDYVKYVILMSLFAPDVKQDMSRISEVLNNPFSVVRAYSKMLAENFKEIYMQSHPEAKYENFEGLDTTDLELNGDDCQKVSDSLRNDVIRIMQKQRAGQNVSIPKVPLPKMHSVNESEFMQGCLYERNRNGFVKTVRNIKWTIEDKIENAIAKISMRF